MNAVMYHYWPKLNTADVNQILIVKQLAGEICKASKNSFLQVFYEYSDSGWAQGSLEVITFGLCLFIVWSCRKGLTVLFVRTQMP